MRTFCEDIQSLLLLLLAHEGVSWGYRGVWEGSQPLFLLTVPLCLTLPQTRGGMMRAQIIRFSRCVYHHSLVGDLSSLVLLHLPLLPGVEGGQLFLGWRLPNLWRECDGANRKHK